MAEPSASAAPCEGVQLTGASALRCDRGDAGGGGSPTCRPRPGVRDDGLECTVTSVAFRWVVSLFPGVECALCGHLVPTLPRARVVWPPWLFSRLC